MNRQLCSVFLVLLSLIYTTSGFAAGLTIDINLAAIEESKLTTIKAQADTDSTQIKKLDESEIASLIAKGSITPCGTVCFQLFEVPETSSSPYKAVAVATNNTTVDFDFIITATSSNMTPPMADAYITIQAGSTYYVYQSEQDDPSSRFNWNINWDFNTTTPSAHDDDFLYELPYENGKSRKSLIRYTNLYAFEMSPQEGVYSARAGKVIGVDDSHNRYGYGENFEIYANRIMILHEDGSLGIYSSLYQNSAKVKAGDEIQQGQLIASAGQTGMAFTNLVKFYVLHSQENYEYRYLRVLFLSSDGVEPYLYQGRSYTATHAIPQSEQVKATPPVTTPIATENTYNGSTGVVHLPIVQVGAVTYDVYMQHLGDLVFQVTMATLTTQTATAPNTYNEQTGVLDIPSITVDGATFKVQMIHQGNLVFKVTSVQ
jgi:hypothetical protein